MQNKDHSEKYKIVKYGPSLQDAWEKMVLTALSGTLLHTRKFLSYHGNKFKDQSVLIYDQDDTLRAVFPAANDPTNDKIVISHPGITYGGLLHNGWLRGQRCLDVLLQLLGFYAEAGFDELRYKAVPWIYHRMPAQDDIYALFRLGADRYRVDLSATIDLQNRGILSERRDRALKKAKGHGLRIDSTFDNLDRYWQILAANLDSKHKKTPVHSVKDLCVLKEKFPEDIELVTAVNKNNEIVAGSLLFNCPTLIHAQYFASTEDGRKTGALDLVIEYTLERAEKLGKRYFDFGISSDEQGTYLNDSLHTFKCEFGACASVYEFYKIKTNDNSQRV